MALVSGFRLVVLPGTETLNGDIRQQAHHRYFTLCARYLHFFVDQRVVKAYFSGIVTSVAEVDGVKANPVDRPQAHGARLATGVENTARQLEGTQRLAGFTNGVHFGVGSGIVAGGNTVHAGRNHFSVADHDRAKWAAVAVQHVFCGQPDGQLHEVFLGLHVIPQRRFRLHSLHACSNIRSMTQAFVSSRVVTPEGVRPGAVLVADGRILAVCARADVPPAARVHDFGDKVLLPGLVDSHVHINEPGRTEWEGFATATRAAAAGGFSTLVDMPLNCLPETTTVAALEAKRIAAAGQCSVDWAAWGGLVGTNRQHLAPLAAAGVAGFKCFLVDPGIAGLAMISQDELAAAAPTLADVGLPLLVHAELAEHLYTGGEADDWQQYATYLHSRPDASELAAVRMLIELCRTHRFPLHIVHLSSALALPELAQARAEGLPLTVETCPHYLHFVAEEISAGNTLCKCAPPIRSRANREALWQGLRDGVIDLIATDHSLARRR